MQKTDKLKGSVFIIVVGLSVIMLLGAMEIINLMMNDIYMVKHIIKSTKAQYLAEAGIAHALSTIDDLGFSSKDTADNFPLTNFGGGTYDVNVVQNGGRILLVSTGASSGTARTVSAEIKDLSPQAIYYSMAAGNELKAVAGVASITLNGKVHANNKVNLKTTVAVLTVSSTATAYTDYVYATAYRGLIFSWPVYINGISYPPTGGIFSYTLYTLGDAASESEFKGPLVEFPTPTKLNYDYYKTIAQSNGSYYSGDKTFSNETITPSAGIVYVDGAATFEGNCTLNGGIIARDKITVKHHIPSWTRGNFQQTAASHRRNMVVSRTNNIEIGVSLGTLGCDFRTNSAMVYAANDFRVCELLSIIDITGAFLASGNLDMWGIVSRINYTYAPISLDKDHNNIWTKVVSWNR